VSIKPLRERLQSQYLNSDKADHYAAQEKDILSRVKTYWDL